MPTDTAPEKPKQWELVPPTTKPSTCGGATCRAKIYWITRKSTAKKYATTPAHMIPVVTIPVDCAVEGGIEPKPTEALPNGSWSLTVTGKGVSHYTTCPDHAQFHKSVR